MLDVQYAYAVTSIVDPRSPPSLYIVSGGESVIRNTVYEYYAYSDVSSLVDLDLLPDFMLGLGEKELLVTPFISLLLILMSPSSWISISSLTAACFLRTQLLSEFTSVHVTLIFYYYVISCTCMYMCVLFIMALLPFGVRSALSFMLEES